MTFDKIREIIAEQLGIDADTITMESSFVDDLGADSLDIVSLIMAMEEEFAEDDADKIKTVGDAVNYISD